MSWNKFKPWFGMANLGVMPDMYQLRAKQFLKSLFKKALFTHFPTSFHPFQAA